MFVFSFKATTLKYIGVMTLCALAIIMTVVLVPSDGLTAVPTSAVPLDKVEGDADLLDFIKAYGWETEAEPLSVITVTIPESFDAVYSEYNELQKKVGMDLSDYKGKEAKLYTFELKNESGLQKLNLLVYKNKVIGGDVCSSSPDGLMYSLKGK